MLGYAAYVVGLCERQATAHDKIRNAAFKGIRRIAHKIRVVDQIESDLGSQCFIIPAAGHLTEATPDECRAIMRPGSIAVASAVDAVDQLDAKIRIARK